MEWYRKVNPVKRAQRLICLHDGQIASDVAHAGHAL
jgi:hypothetical protein